MAPETHSEGGEQDLAKPPVDLQARVLALENDLSGAKKELATRIKHYESKLVTMTVINSALQNENEKLKEDAVKLQHGGGPDQDLAELQEEFTKRLGIAERTASNMKEECFTLRQQVEDFKKGKEVLMKEIEQKKSSINQYVTEGEKLSIKIGELESIIKKCRADLAKTGQEKEKLVSRVQVLEDAAKETELSRSMNATEASQALQQTQQALEAAREQAEEDLQFAREERKADVARLSQQMEEREKFWAANLDSLRTSLTKANKTASEREDALREEMRRLEERCRTSEAAQEEATARLSEATMPLVRQITQREAHMEERELQHKQQLQELEASATTTLDALKTAEAGTAAAEKRAETAEYLVNELRAEFQSTLENVQQLEEKIQELKENLHLAEEKLMTSEIAYDELKDNFLLAEEKAALAEQEKDDAVEHCLAEQAAREEAERLLEEAKLELTAEAEGIRHQFQTLKASLAEQEREFRARMTSLRTASLGVNSAKNFAEPDNAELQSKEVSPKKQVSSPDFTPDVNEIDLAKGGLTPTPVNMERLVSEVRRLQGEVAQLHKDLKAAQSARDHASEDLLKATEKLNTLEKDIASAPKVRKELEELKKRHEMALVIIGEMNEKSDELEADMSDVKTLYREQMNLLISQIDPAKWPDGYRICLFCSHCAQEQRRTKRGSVN
ncbi:unnamed protein product [Calypogeia fissa]